MSPPAPRVAVVVSTRNRADRLARLFTALRMQSLDSNEFEVVVADNGSSDDTPELLSAEAARDELRLTAIRRAPGEGPAPAREEAWRRATASVIAFTDDDCEPDPRWLEEGLAALERNPGGFVQGRTLPNPAERGRMGPFSRTIRIERLNLNLNTCNVFYPRQHLERVGGFDTERFARGVGGEDLDLGWRVMGELGARPSFAPEALTYHAVNELGPIGKLRVAGRPMDGFAYHSELRRTTFVCGLFWKRSHLSLALIVLGLALPARWWPARLALVLPYAREIRARLRVFGGGPSVAIYHVLHDLIEVAAVARAAIRHRVPMI